MIREQKLEQWAERELLRNIKNIIVPDEQNGFLAFGHYYLRADNQLCWVELEHSTVACFSNKKTAISWCIADKYHQYSLANSILSLDQKKQLLENDVRCHQQQLAHTKNFDFAEVLTAKLQPKISQLAAINTELEKCLKTTKYFQIRGFSNETARTRVS